MPRLPQVAGIDTPSFPRQSPAVASAQSRSLAELGGEIANVALGWEKRSADLKRFNEVTSRSTAASLAVDQAYREELEDPDYGTLGARMERRTRDIVDEIGGDIRDSEARTRYREQAEDLAVHTILRARDEQRHREIGAGRAIFEEAMDADAALAEKATGAELATIIARSKGRAAAAAAAGLYGQDEAENYFRTWSNHVEHAKVLQEIDADPLRAFGDLRAGEHKELDALTRQQLIGAAEAEIEQRMRASEKPWQDDPATLLAATHAVQSGQMGHQELGELYFPKKLISEESWKALENDLTAREKTGEGATTALKYRQSQAEQEMGRSLAPIPGPMGAIDFDAQQRYAVALREQRELSSAFGGPLDPLEASDRIAKKYLPAIMGAEQSRLNLRAATLPTWEQHLRSQYTMDPDQWDEIADQIIQLQRDQEMLNQRGAGAVSVGAP